MKSIIILLILISLTFVSCSNKVLEFNYATLDVKEKIINDKNIIEIKGHCFHSALNIKEVELTQNDSSITCLVYLTLSDGLGTGGSFNQDIEITPNIQNIYFGKNKQLIWQK